MSTDSFVTRLRQWLADDSVVYECRNCGTTLDDRRDTCPSCGDDHVVSYTLE